MKEIAKWFLENVITSKDFNNKNGVKDTAILFPPFFAKVQKGIAEFNKKYPNVTIVFVETYRSNDRQLMHFNNGASKIRKDGMHHFSIAVDLAGNVNGKFTYDIDYKHLRSCMANQGLTLLGLWDAGHFQYIPVKDQTALRNACYGAIKDFQKKYGLKVDGIPGTKQTIPKAKEVFKK